MRVGQDIDVGGGLRAKEDQENILNSLIGGMSGGEREGAHSSIDGLIMENKLSNLFLPLLLSSPTGIGMDMFDDEIKQLYHLISSWTEKNLTLPIEGSLKANKTGIEEAIKAGGRFKSSIEEAILPSGFRFGEREGEMLGILPQLIRTQKMKTLPSPEIPGIEEMMKLLK